MKEENHDIVQFPPWVGKYYDGILVLGESHYQVKDGEQDPTGNIIRRQFESGPLERFFTHIAKSFIGPDRYLSPKDKEEFYNRIAFYNYVQHNAGTASRVRPKPWMWVYAQFAFPAVVERLQPKVIVAFGRALYHNLPMTGIAGLPLPDEPPKDSATWLYRCGDLLCLPIPPFIPPAAITAAASGIREL
jgi:hypothetical protein